MFLRRSHLIALVAAISVLVIKPASGQASQGQPAQGQAAAGQPTAPKKEWKDRAEYDLYDTANKALATRPPDYNKALTALDQWKAKYPQSNYAVERSQLYYFTYEGLAQFDKTIETGNEILNADPKNWRILVDMTALIPRLKSPTPDMLASTEKAAKTLLANIDSLKPAEVPDTEWKKVPILAHTNLGLIAQLRKNNEEAEKEFKEALKLNPNNGQVDYWLGTAILQQRKPETQAEALFYFARAAAYDGPGALTPEGRKEVQNYLTKAYVTYHGSQEGLPQILALAKENAAPPPDFKILSGPEVEAKKQEDLAKSNPELALWTEIKKQLTAPDGEQYFQQHMKDAAVPELTGYLVSQSPARNPKQLVLAMSDTKTPEVALKLTEGTLVGSAEAGTKISFEGIPTAFAKDPFMVTFDVDKAKLKGWTGKAAPPARKAPPKKGASKKK